MTPETYNGYSAEGIRICSCTAADANNYLNPEEVRRAIDNVKEAVSEGLRNINKALQEVAQDADEAVVIKGTKMESTIEEICTSIAGLESILVDPIASLYNDALQAHDKIQNDLNEQARSAVSRTVGVVRIS